MNLINAALRERSRSQKAPAVSRAGGSIKAGSRQVVAILGLMVGLFPPAPSLYGIVNLVATGGIRLLQSILGSCGVDQVSVESITVAVEWIGSLWSGSQVTVE